MSKKALVSVIIISYRNYNYIYTAIDSVINQDYGNLELIISNDGSNDFNKKAIEEYIKKHKHKNLIRFTINNNKTNLGTVKNANKALKLVRGKYILLFAADDAMYDKTIVSKFVHAFSQLSSSELIVTSQLGMYDRQLTKLKELFVSEINKEKILNLPPKKLFGELALQCMIPSAGTCYKKEIFEKYGYFDEKYFLVEDYSSSLKYSRLGIKHNYFDFLSFKHRDGGISHGNSNGQAITNKKFDIDIIHIMDKEILPHIHLLNEFQKKVFRNIYKERKWRFDYTYKYELGTKSERRKFVRDNFWIFVSCITKNLILGLREEAAFFVLIGTILFIMYNLNFNFGKGFTSIFYFKEPKALIDNINWFIGFIGILTIIIGISFITIPMIYKIFKKIYKFLKHIL